ncbi:MAG: methyltransferase domain-containing protein [Candidatus Helarchaeota archaeon]|nr:methyltransferase domain-containing protein [Candidatus Helarchaeota archaeon]
MGRLDIFLVENNLIPTRSRAKRAILYGLVKVNGKFIRKPASSVKKSDKVEILDELATKSVGYWKLQAILNSIDLELFKSTDRVLDLGSSAGGFLEFVAKRCQKVYGVEISDEFAPQLYYLKQKYPNISVQITDAFKLDPRNLPDFGQIDTLLIDLTLDPSDSIKILEKFLLSLKPQGYIIMAIKIGDRSPNEYKKNVKASFKTLNLKILRILDIDPEKKELHVIAQKQ